MGKRKNADPVVDQKDVKTKKSKSDPVVDQVAPSSSCEQDLAQHPKFAKFKKGE